MNLPDYNFLPAPLFIITILHLVTFTLHLLAMNFLLGGVVIVLWGKLSHRWEDPTVQKCIKLFPSAMAATVTLGIAPLLFLQLVYPKQMYSAAIVSGWFWMIIVAAVIIAYYCLYKVAFLQDAGNGRKGLFLSVALLGLLYVSFIYSSVFSMAERPDLIKALYAGNQSGLVINPELGDYIFRWLHMVFGALTVGGFFVGFLGKDNDQAYKVGKNFFLWGMIIASVFGLLYLLSLGEHLRYFMKSPAVYYMTAGIILSLGSLHLFFKQKFLVSGLAVFLSVLMMVTTRHYVRLLRLEGTWDPSTIKVMPQWSVFIIFLICFLIAIGLIAYMLRLYFRREPLLSSR